MKLFYRNLFYVLIFGFPTTLFAQTNDQEADNRFYIEEIDASEAKPTTNTPNPNAPVLGTNGEITILDFEGLGNVDSINEFYNGGLSAQGLTGEDFNISFNAGALSLIDSDEGGSGNFANELSPSTILVFLDEEPILDALDGFEDGFSFYYSSVDTPGSVTVFDGPNGTGNIVGSATFEGLGQDPEDVGGDPTGINNRWASVSVPIDGVGFSIIFSGVANAIGFDNVTFGSVTPGQTCPTEDVVLRTQEDIDEFAATYPNCTNMPVGIFITEDRATPGDVMDFSPLSFIETIAEHLVFWRVRSATDFSGFENLTSVGDVLGINSMANVTSLNGLQNVETVGWFQVTSTRNLTSLDDLTALTTIEDRIVISSNRNLSACSIDAVCDLLNAGGSARVFGNASGCSSVSEIEVECGNNGVVAGVDLEVFPNPATTSINLGEIELTSYLQIIDGSVVYNSTFLRID